jgi:hypothetical protein
VYASEKKLNNFTHMGDTTPRPILMNFGTLGSLYNLITFASFGFDWMRVFVPQEAEDKHFLYLASTTHSAVQNAPASV